MTFAPAAVPGGRHDGGAGLRSGAWGVAVAWVAAGSVWLRANFVISGGCMVALHSDIRGRKVFIWVGCVWDVIHRI